MKNKNIWFLHHYAIPNQLGVGERPYRLAQNLIKRGYNVKVFAASTVHNSDINYIEDDRKYIVKEFNGVPFVFVKARSYKGNGRDRVKNMFDYSLGVISVSKEFESEKPDIIYASSVHPLTWISGYILSRKYKAKFIAETRDLWPETLVVMGKLKRNSFIARILYMVERFVYKKADRVVFTMPGGKDYVESIGLDINKVRHINNGIDLQEFNYNMNKFVYDDVDLNDNSSFKIIFAGSIGRANAIDRVIKAAQIILNKGYTNIKILIFGDGPERERLEKYVNDNNIKNVVFKGRVDKKYVPNILSKADLNIFSLEHLPNLFKYGLSPNKMFDYFASGKPTISNVECGYDMLEKFNCGITVKGENEEALAEGILKFYNMPKEIYNKYCKNALIAAQNFDYSKLTDELEKIINEL